MIPHTGHLPIGIQCCNSENTNTIVSMESKTLHTTSYLGHHSRLSQHLCRAKTGD